jgi:GNAT superfamily N-acetyltransferase
MRALPEGRCAALTGDSSSGAGCFRNDLAAPGMAHTLRLMTQAPNALVIREATPGDLPSVLGMLSRDALREKAEDLGPPIPQPYLDALAEITRDPNNAVLVAELDGQIVGTFQLTFIRHLMYGGALIAQIESVRVDTSCRNQGIGAGMMTWAIDEARRRGCVRVQLTTHKQRKDAHRFYARLGFVASHEGMKLPLR